MENIEEIKQVLEGFRTLAEATQYKINPTEALRLKAETVYQARQGELVAALKTTTASPEDIAIFLEDYRAALLGSYDFKATQPQMRKALELRMLKAYQIGRYDFFTPFYAQYSQQVASWNLYVMMMRTDARPEGKKLYLGSSPDAFQICYLSHWLTEPGRIQPEDFDGVTPAELSRALSMTKDTRAALDYFTYILVAKYGLNATREELESVAAPDLSAFDLGASPLEWAVSQADAIAAKMEERGENGGYFRTLPKKEGEAAAATRTTDTRPEPMRRRQQQPLDLKKFNTLALSRPLEEIRSQGPIVRDEAGREMTLKAMFKDIASESHEGLREINGLPVGKCFEMLSVMIEPQVRQQLGCVEDWERGMFIFENLNISKLAEIAGYKDAHESVKAGIRNFLYRLSGVEVRRPRATSHDKKSKQKKAEPVVDIIRPFWLVRRASDWRDFDLCVAVGLMSGNEKPVYIEGQKKALLREMSTGTEAQERFNAQLFTKPYKLEDELLDEVFGYSYELRELTEEEAALRKAAESALHELPDLEKRCKRMKDVDRFDTVRAAWVEMAEDDERKPRAEAAVRALSKLCECLKEIKEKKRKQGKNKQREREKLAKWFEQYEQRGILTYSYSKNSKGMGKYQWLVNSPDIVPEHQEQPKDGAEVLTS